MPSNILPASAIFGGTATELIETRPGTPFNADGSRSYTRKFQVIVTDSRFRLVGSSQVCRAAGIPKPFSPYILPDGLDSDLAAVCTRLSAEKELKDDWQKWIVTAEYNTSGIPEGGIPSAFDLGDSGLGFQNNPELERPIIYWDSEEVTRALPQDLDGKAFTTSAGQPYSPPPVFETARAILVMSRNELIVSRVKMTKLAFAVNSDIFLGAPPGTVRLKPLTSKPMQRGSIGYWVTTYRFVFGAPRQKTVTNEIIGAASGILEGLGVPPAVPDDELEPWQPEILDAGTMKSQLLGGLIYTGKPIPIMRGPNQVTQPVLLDGSGRELQKGEDGKFKPVFNKFRVYQALPFTKLVEGVLGI